MKMVHTKQLIHAIADRMQVVNLKYTTLLRNFEHYVVPGILYNLPELLTALLTPKVQGFELHYFLA